MKKKRMKKTAKKSRKGEKEKEREDEGEIIWRGRSGKDGMGKCRK